MKIALENGMIDIQTIQNKIEMYQRKELLEKHDHKIWCGKDGKWYTYVYDEKGVRTLKKRNSKKEIEDVIVGIMKEKMENPTIKEVFDEWNDRRLELKKISSSTHLRNQQVYNRHYSEFGEKRIKSVSQLDFEEFLEEQIPEHDLTAKAFANLKTITRGFLKRAKKRKLITFNVEDVFNDLDTSETDFRKIIKEDYEEVFSEEEMPIIMDYLKNNLDITNIGILLMFLTGMRIGEVVALKYEDFDTNCFHVRRTETRFTDSTGKYVCGIKDFPKTQAGVRSVIIPSDYLWLVDMMKEQNPGNEFIFMRNGKRITTQAMRMRLKRMCKKLNIYHKSPHKIRKTYGSILLDYNIDRRLIIEQMGHTDIACTERHYHRNRRSNERKGEIISSIPEFHAG